MSNVPSVTVEGGSPFTATQSDTTTDQDTGVSQISAVGASPCPPPQYEKDCPFIDTSALAVEVRHYLNSNQIQWTRFAKLVLGVSQSRLSTLIGKPQPWHLLTRRVQGLYQRMRLWMDTRATYGNNPYQRPAGRSTSGRPGMKTRRLERKRKPRTLFDLEENMDLLKSLKQTTCPPTNCRRIVEECVKENIMKVKEEAVDIFEEQHEVVFTLGEEVVEDLIEDGTFLDPLCVNECSCTDKSEESRTSGGLDIMVVVKEETLAMVGVNEESLAGHHEQFHVDKKQLEEESRVMDSEIYNEPSTTGEKIPEPIPDEKLSFFSFLANKSNKKVN